MQPRRRNVGRDGGWIDGRGFGLRTGRVELRRREFGRGGRGFGRNAGLRARRKRPNSERQQQ